MSYDLIPSESADELTTLKLIEFQLSKLILFYSSQSAINQNSVNV